MKLDLSRWALAAAAAALALAAGCDSPGESDEGNDTVSGDDALTAESDAVVEDDVTAETTLPTEETAGEELPPADDTTPPDVVVELEQYAAFQAGDMMGISWTDEGGVAAVEVYIDGQLVGAVSPDAKIVVGSGIPAGMHDVSVKVTDLAGNVTETQPVPALFAGPGMFLPYLDGWKQGVTPGWGGFLKKVADGATSIYDDKAHVTVPDGIKEVRAYLRWKSKTEWDMGFDIGTGNCPDSGKKLAAGEGKGKSGLIEVTYTNDGNAVPTGKWFAHMRYKDGGNHGGEEQQFDSIFLVLP